MGKSSKSVTVGFKYFASMHYGVCHGQIEAFRGIWFGEKQAWSGFVPIDAPPPLIYINQPGLFGGDESEGGVFGWVEFGHGSTEQSLIGVESNGTYDNAGLFAALKDVDTGIPVGSVWSQLRNSRYNSLRPATPPFAVNYRGLAVVNLHSFCVGNNAYLKEVSFDVERYNTQDNWHPTKAKIFLGLSGGTTEELYGMNAIHIIWEAYTNTTWGLGNPKTRVNEASFIAAADRIFDEAVGLSTLLADDQTAESFIDEIKEVINATTYDDPITNQFTIRLLRSNDPVELVIDSSNATLETYSRKALSQTVNEISASYVNPITEKYQTTTVHDIANIEAQGRSVQIPKTYNGVRSEQLAQKLAQRDLLATAATLASAEVVVDQSAWKLVPGSVVELRWPEGIKVESLRMRVVDKTQVAYNRPDIRLTLSEDVFGQQQAQFTLPQTPGGGDDSVQPKLFDHFYVWELPFWFIMQSAGVTVDSVPPEASYSTVLTSDPVLGVVRNSLYSLLQTPTDAVWQPVASGPITPFAELATDYPAAVQNSLAATGPSAVNYQSVTPGLFFLITDGVHEEICQVVSLTGFSILADRGLMDTQPRKWLAGASLYFIGLQNFAVDSTQRSMGEFVQYKPVMQTARGERSVYDVPVSSETLQGRFGTPYPPANVQIESSYFPATVSRPSSTKDVTVAWSTRNKLLQQTPVQLKWNEGSVTPETGTVFNVELWQGGTLVGSAYDITGTSVAVACPSAVSGVMQVLMWSELDGIDSYTVFDHTFNFVIT